MCLIWVKYLIALLIELPEQFTHCTRSAAAISLALANRRKVVQFVHKETLVVRTNFSIKPLIHSAPHTSKFTQPHTHTRIYTHKLLTAGTHRLDHHHYYHHYRHCRLSFLLSHYFIKHPHSLKHTHTYNIHWQYTFAWRFTGTNTLANIPKSKRCLQFKYFSPSLSLSFFTAFSLVDHLALSLAFSRWLSSASSSLSFIC